MCTPLYFCSACVSQRGAKGLSQGQDYHAFSRTALSLSLLPFKSARRIFWLFSVKILIVTHEGLKDENTWWEKFGLKSLLGTFREDLRGSGTEQTKQDSFESKHEFSCFIQTAFPWKGKNDFDDSFRLWSEVLLLFGLNYALNSKHDKRFNISGFWHLNVPLWQLVFFNQILWFLVFCSFLFIIYQNSQFTKLSSTFFILKSYFCKLISFWKFVFFLNQNLKNVYFFFLFVLSRKWRGN